MLFSFISGPAKHFTKLSLVGARNKTISKMLQDNNRSRIRKMSSEGHNGDCCSATVSRRSQLHVLLRNCALRNRAQLLQHFPLHRQRRSSLQSIFLENFCLKKINFEHREFEFMNFYRIMSDVDSDSMQLVGDRKLVYSPELNFIKTNFESGIEDEVIIKHVVDFFFFSMDQ